MTLLYPLKIMNREYNVLAPGPVNLHPEVIKSLALPMIHHRTPEFDAILKRVLTNLKAIFQTKQPVFALTCTGSGGMEALLVNVLQPGDKVIGIDSGKFGERWCEMAKVYGANLVEYKVPWGQSASPEQLKKLLLENPDTQIVMTQACETSTGSLHPIKELSQVIKENSKALFIVDGITALGAVPLPMDDWSIDGLVGGSQKAFMLPTGMSFLSFSEKAWLKISSNSQPRFYFDIRKELQANQKGETYFSSNVSLIRALDVVLNLIQEKGFPQHLHEIQARAEFCRWAVQKLGMNLYSVSPSNSLTAAVVPEGIDSQKVRAKLEEKHRITLMGGQDQAKGKILRIGHMGYIKSEQMVNLFLHLLDTLIEVSEEYRKAWTSEKIQEFESELQLKSKDL